jgi:hypothetical protein
MNKEKSLADSRKYLERCLKSQVGGYSDRENGMLSIEKISASVRDWQNYQKNIWFYDCSEV